jgi:PAS domain S-box-containing protein
MTDDPRPGEVTTGDVPDALPALPHFWRELFDRAPAAISVVSPEGRQVAGNAAYAALFGYTQAEVEQLHVSQLTRPEDQRWTEGYLRRLRDGEIDGYQTEKVYVRSDGSTFRAALDVRAVRRDGRLRALIGVIVPIHRREPLGGGRLRKLVEHIHDTITLLDADGTLIETTGRYTPILGYPAEFWERRTAFDVIVDEDVPRLLELRAQILDKPGEVVHATMRVRDSDNAVQLLDAHAVNLLDDPEVGGIVVTTRNVTTEHQLLQQLRDSRDEAVAEAELRSRMIATVSHELRNPLHAVQGISELLNAGPLTEESRQLARTLDRQLRALTRVVDDLLTSSRIELGSMRVELDDVDLRAIVDDVVSVASLDAASGVVVRSTVDDDLPPLVRTDPVRFRQVLTNLVGNAVKFTDRGSVDVTVRVEPGRQLVLEVTDTGPGIAADEQTMIFEPFRSSANAGRAAGAGLGLSIVERIVTMLGGSVSVSSALGAGSTFTVELPPAPFSEAPDDDPGRGRIARPVMLSGIDVVVIEDDPVNQQVAEAQLRSLGASYHIVGTGEEGVELVAQRAAEGLPVDVVLMDHHLPGIKGTEAARRIRSDEQATGRRVPIIGVSADASAADRGRSLAAGMDDHLVKPVSLVQLSTAIRRAVDRDASRMSQRHAQVVEVNGPGPVLDRLADELGDRSVVVEVVEVYLGELDRRVDGIVGAVRIGDGEAVRRLVHTLTAGSELLGVGALPTSCSAFARGELDEAGLRATAAAARDALVRWASSNTG